MHQILCKSRQNVGSESAAISATETLATIGQVLGEDSMSRARVFDGMVGSRPVGCPLTTSKTQRDSLATQRLITLSKFNSSFMRVDIRDLADEMVIGNGTCQQILSNELGAHRVAAKFVSRILTVDRKQHCDDVSKYASTGQSSCPGLSQAMRDGFTVAILRQSGNPPNGRGDSKVKSMLIISFDIKAIVTKIS